MNSRFNEQSYYEILEIEPGAPQHEIYEAYRRAKETYSSESPALYSMFSKEEARELMSLIEEAFSTLSHQGRRAAYDQKLNRMANQSSEALPDFDPISQSTQSATAQAQKVSVSTVPAPEKIEMVPDGFAKTKFGVYEVDESFETEIAENQEIDGPFLQKIRLYKQINLVQVSEETRISKSYLAALEANDFEALPAQVFVRGFVVQVARILGLDDKHIASSYMKFYKASNGG